MLTISRSGRPSGRTNKLDRLGWSDEMSFMSYGVPVGVRVNDSTLLNRAISRLPPRSEESSLQVVDHLYSLVRQMSKAESPVRMLNLAYCNETRIARTREVQDMLDGFESHVQLTVAEHAPSHVFVHSGVVGWKDRAILIPGTSHSGKTTLVDQLIRAGATYYSDEYAVLDRRGRVLPYARPLRLRFPDSLDRKRIKAEEIGAAVGFKPLRIGLVVFTCYEPGARWRPRRLTCGNGVLELMANTVSARSRTARALSVLPKALESAQILKGCRGEAHEAADAVLQFAG